MTARAVRVHGSGRTARSRRARYVLSLPLIAAMTALRFVHLDADIPRGLTWSGDAYADEGFYLTNAREYGLTGQWLIPGAMNPLLALPVVPAIHGAVFGALQPTLRTARATTAVLAVLTAVVVFLMATRTLMGICIIWIGGHCAMLIMGGYAPPRYLMPLVVPVAIFGSVAGLYAWRTAQHRAVRVLVAALLIAAVGHNAHKITRHMSSLEYSFREMSRDIRQHVTRNRDTSPVLVGHLAETVALATGLQVIDDWPGTSDVGTRMRSGRPGYYLRMGPAPSGDAVRQLRGLELLAVYDVFHNYHTGKPLFFYRLDPLDSSHDRGTG